MQIFDMFVAIVDEAFWLMLKLIYCCLRLSGVSIIPGANRRIDTPGEIRPRGSD